jgi:hypothetical protein
MLIIFNIIYIFVCNKQHYANKKAGSIAQVPENIGTAG